ncbi:MAG: 50S ribosomal protein L9 [Actinomycetota bacterium]
MSRVKIVLRQPVDKLGEPGDIVSVAGGYARNFLIPRGLAVPATKGNIRHAETWASSRATKDAKALSQAEELKTKLGSKPLVVTAQAGPDGRLFGSVTAADVAGAINDQLGVEVDRHKVELEPIRHTGVHTARVTLHPEVTAEVAVEVGEANPA